MVMSADSFARSACHKVRWNPLKPSSVRGIDLFVIQAQMVSQRQAFVQKNTKRFISTKA